MSDDQANGPRRFIAVDPMTITEPVALSIGLYAFTGQGKTESSLRLAHGIARVARKRVRFADCDNGRALHFFRAGMFPGTEYIDFKAPHNALDYVALLEQSASENVVLVIDNMTAEHEGEGGLIDTFERAKRGQESRNAVAWAVAKAQHKRLRLVFSRVNRQMPIIVTWRAQDKIDWNARDERGKAAPQNQGEMPIGSKDLPYEMTATYLLPVGSRGAPCLAPTEKGERLMTKIPRWFECIVKPGEKFCEEHGEAMARWAFGADASKQQPRSEYERLWWAIDVAEHDALDRIETECKTALSEKSIHRGEMQNLSRALDAKREQFRNLST